MKHILLIQTAFIGDVILATSLVETMAQKEGVKIDVLVRKGNESLLENNPYIHSLWVWDKGGGKYKNLLRLTRELRKTTYDVVYNLQRFGATGYMTWRLRSKLKVGFESNPFSFSYDRKVPHKIGDGRHETERNFDLIQSEYSDLTGPLPPKLYPRQSDEEKMLEWVVDKEYFVMAPSSVWYTKQLPFEKWIELINQCNLEATIYLIGAPGDKEYLETIRNSTKHQKVINLAGRLSLLQSAILIRDAKRSFVNDSAPLHLASAMNAPVTAFFCSTVPSFGFGPLSSDSEVLGVNEGLDCRPCGLHGYKACPKGHFKCGKELVLPSNHLVD